MIRDSNIEIVRGDTETVITPVYDGDSDTDDDFVTPLPDASEINYVLATDFADDAVIWEAPADQIDTPTFGETAVSDENIPGDIEVVRVKIPRSETSTLDASTDDEPTLVHECQLRDEELGQSITVMQGDVTVVPSATTETTTTPSGGGA